jgi:beta-N-acetylhexosaminidase
VAADLGTRLRRCGIDVNFAPVADVDSQTHNPVIGVRAFGATPELVARHVAAFVAGQQHAGIAAAAKHFPGHGATREDSHLTVPVLDQSLDEIHRIDLPPFRAALKAGVKIVMTAHVLAPALDDASPATLSRAAITGLLRDELGFGGVVMTDGLDMHAISRGVGHAEAGVLALLAGVDALCVGGDSTDPEIVESMAGALVDAVRSGRLPLERLAEAAARVEDLRHWCQAARTSPASAPPTPLPGAGSAAAAAAGRADTTHGRVVLDSAPVVLELHDEPSLATGDVPWGIGAPIAARLAGTVVVPVRETGSDIERILEPMPERRVVISVRGVRRRPWQALLVEAVRVMRPDVIVVDHEIGSPAGVLGEHYVLTHGAARITAEVAAELMTTPTPTR